MCVYRSKRRGEAEDMSGGCPQLAQGQLQPSSLPHDFHRQGTKPSPTYLVKQLSADEFSSLATKWVSRFRILE